MAAAGRTRGAPAWAGIQTWAMLPRCLTQSRSARGRLCPCPRACLPSAWQVRTGRPAGRQLVCVNAHAFTRELQLLSPASALLQLQNVMAVACLDCFACLLVSCIWVDS